MPKIGWSPSQQPHNQYAGGGEGYTDSEQYWMELLAAACHHKWLEQDNGVQSVVITEGSWRDNAAASNRLGVTHHVAQHTNAGGGRGCDVFYYTGSAEGKRMAEVFYKYVSAATDTPDRRVIATRNLGELNSTRAIAVLVEYQFHDSIEGAAEIRRSIDEFAEASVKAMCEVLSVPYKSGVSVPAPAPQPAPAPAPAPTPVAGMLVKVKSSTLNVRAGVGTGHRVTTTVRRGEVFTIMETARSADGGTWGRLKSGAGWMNIGAAYVDRVGGAAPAPAPVAPKPAPAYLTVRTNGAALMLRASAAGNARILKRIPNGSRVELVSRGGAWHNVRYQGVTGWVSSQWVK